MCMREKGVIRGELSRFSARTLLLNAPCADTRRLKWRNARVTEREAVPTNSGEHICKYAIFSSDLRAFPRNVSVDERGKFGKLSTRSGKYSNYSVPEITRFILPFSDYSTNLMYRVRYYIASLRCVLPPFSLYFLLPTNVIGLKHCIQNETL